jgi:hypothetical protein
VTLCLIIACQRDNAIIDSNHSETFTYQSYDSLGNLIVDGWLKIQLKDSVTVAGSWRLDNLGNRTDIGIQDGEGELLGQIDDSLISINLNPEYADHNVYLNGNMSDEIIEGDWIWTTFSGPTNWGTFKAIKE